MTIDEFSRSLIEAAVAQLDEKMSKSALAKKIHKGEDVGKKGKNFEKVAAKAAEKYGSAEKGKKVAAAAMWKNLAKEELELDEAKNKEGKEQGADGKACWKGYRYAGTEKGKDKCVKSEEWEGSKEDKEEDKKLAKKNKMSLSTWEKSAADKKHDMKKEEVEKAEKDEKDEGGKHKEYKHAKGKEEKGEKKTEKEMKEARNLPGNQEKIDANKNGKIDAHDFALLRNKRAKKSVKEMWEKAAQVAEGKKVEIEIMPTVDTPNDPEPPTGRKPTEDIKKKLKKEEVESLEERKLSKAETAKKEKFVKGMKKKYGAFKSKYGERAKEVMYATATKMGKKAA